MKTRKICKLITRAEREKNREKEKRGGRRKENISVMVFLITFYG